MPVPFRYFLLLIGIGGGSFQKWAAPIHGCTLILDGLLSSIICIRDQVCRQILRCLLCQAKNISCKIYDCDLHAEAKPKVGDYFTAYLDVNLTFRSSVTKSSGTSMRLSHPNVFWPSFPMSSASMWMTSFTVVGIPPWTNDSFTGGYEPEIHVLSNHANPYLVFWI